MQLLKINYYIWFVSVSYLNQPKYFNNEQYIYKH